MELLFALFVILWLACMIHSGPAEGDLDCTIQNEGNDRMVLFLSPEGRFFAVNPAHVESLSQSVDDSHTWVYIRMAGGKQHRVHWSNDNLPKEGCIERVASNLGMEVV